MCSTNLFKKKSNYVSVGKILEVASIKQFISQADKLKEKLRIIILLSLNRGIIDESDLNSFIKDIEAKGEKLSVEEVEKRAVKHNLVCETREQVIKEIKSLSEDMVKYQKVFNCYKKYTQESYVMPLNIQTISKNRIRRINKFDPSGNMKAPGNVLNEVDESLKIFYKVNDIFVDIFLFVSYHVVIEGRKRLFLMYTSGRMRPHRNIVERHLYGVSFLLICKKSSFSIIFM